jgi:type IV pilus assembly protein PilO
MDSDMANFDVSDIPVSMQFFITALLCAMVFYLAYMIDFSYMRHMITSSQRQEMDLKTQLAGAINAEAEVNADLSQLPQLEKTLKEWQNTLIKSSDVPDLLNDILKTGTANSLQFDLFTPGEKSKVGDYIKVPIKAVVSGNYDQIATFMSQIANMKRLVGIDNFNIEQKNLTSGKKPSEAEANGNLLAELTLEVYYLADK